MTVWHLIVREILHRKLGFALALLSVIVAVGSLVAVLATLRLHDRRTQEILAAKAEETKEEMQKLEDDYRKISLKLGFNILILPKDQNLSDFHSENYAIKTMPESYAEKLAQARVITINHLLPSLQQRVTWPEKKRTVDLVGTRGEVPILHATEKKPLLDHVPRGKMVVGHEIHDTLNLKVGDKVQFQSREFQVAELQPQRGNRDDITIWINLGEAQEMLDKKGLINGILALECNCEADRLDKVRAEIAAILPDTQVLEKQSQAITRAEARTTAAKAAQSALKRVRDDRDQQRQRQEEFASLVVPLVLFACVVWLGVLTFNNVRDRAGELGIFRALGVRFPKLITLVLGRALLLGIVGAVIGVGIGASGAVALGERPETACAWCTAMEPKSMGLVLGLTPLVCALASAAPALRAARQDPAVVLRDN